MVERIKKNETSFGIYLKDEVLNTSHVRSTGTRNFYLIKNITFEFNVNLSLHNNFLHELISENILRVDLEPIRSRDIIFSNCKFNKLIITTDSSQNFQFDNNCEVDLIDFSNCTFNGKVRFYNSILNETVFFNTTFNDLAEFNNCIFKEVVIFQKTDFKGTTVFSASTFKENVLFTYALIEQLIIFRGTKFEQGLDLSLALVKGELNCFDIRLNQFEHYTIDESNEKEFEKKYDKCITPKKGKLSGKIPLKNKRETFRIIKQAFVSRDDISASIKYKALEKETIRQEQKVLLKEINTTGYKWFKQVGLIRFNQLSLWLNKYSNEYTSSYGRAIVFILLGGIPIFYLSAILSDKYCFDYCACDWNWDALYYGIGDFAVFLSPLHNFDYLGKVTNWKPYFQILDFLGRITIGYGIYQFIQAFRKYR